MNKRSYKKWTKEEEQALAELVKSNCKTEAFRIYAGVSGRKAQAIAAYYYSHMLKNGYFSEEEPEATPHKYRYYSDEELKDLLELVSTHPHNLREAFRIHASNTGRNVKSVENYFERYRKKQEAKVCMVNVGGKKHISPNRKNIYPGTGGTIHKTKKPLWKRLLKALFGL